MSIAMSISEGVGPRSESRQAYYSRELANNASRIKYYEEQLSGPLRISQDDIDGIKELIDNLYLKRQMLSDEYMKALRENK